MRCSGLSHCYTNFRQPSEAGLPQLGPAIPDRARRIGSCGIGRKEIEEPELLFPRPRHEREEARRLCWVGRRTLDTCYAQQPSLFVSWRINKNGRSLRGHNWLKDIGSLHPSEPEKSGPKANLPVRKGFGSVIITSVIGSELGCEPSIDYAADGLRYSLECSLSALTGEHDMLRLPI